MLESEGESRTRVRLHIAKGFHEYLGSLEEFLKAPLWRLLGDQSFKADDGSFQILATHEEEGRSSSSSPSATDSWR
jgi:hypothetical protein